MDDKTVPTTGYDRDQYVTVAVAAALSGKSRQTVYRTYQPNAMSGGKKVPVRNRKNAGGDAELHVGELIDRHVLSESVLDREAGLAEVAAARGISDENTQLAIELARVTAERDTIRAEHAAHLASCSCRDQALLLLGGASQKNAETLARVLGGAR